MTTRIGILRRTLGKDKTPEPGPAPIGDDEILPGPYRRDPGDGNDYRAEAYIPARFRERNGESICVMEPHVVITDIFGGHETTITLHEWDRWEPAR